MILHLPAERRQRTEASPGAESADDRESVLPESCDDSDDTVGGDVAGRQQRERSERQRQQLEREQSKIGSAVLGREHGIESRYVQSDGEKGLRGLRRPEGHIVRSRREQVSEKVGRRVVSTLVEADNAAAAPSTKQLGIAVQTLRRTRRRRCLRLHSHNNSVLVAGQNGDRRRSVVQSARESQHKRRARSELDTLSFTLGNDRLQNHILSSNEVIFFFFCNDTAHSYQESLK